MSLWKKVTNAFKPLVKAVAPAAAAMIPGVGPIVAPIVGGAIAMSGRSSPAIPSSVFSATPMTPTNFIGGDMPGTGMTPTVGPLMRGAGRLAAAAGAGAIGRGVGKLLVNGRRIGLQQLKRLVKALGPEAVAAGVGVTVASLAQVMFDMESRATKRRRRGISYADIARTRRTLRRLKSMEHALTGSLPARRTYRRTTKCQ